VCLTRRSYALTLAAAGDKSAMAAGVTSRLFVEKTCVTRPDNGLGYTDRAMAVAERPQTLRPPLKWAGGKRWQVPYLRGLWEAHTHRRLVEPFCGGLAVALGLMPERAVLNDANPHVINFYRWLQRGLRVDLAMVNEEAAYYRHRDRFNALLTSGMGETAEAAQLFYYLNRTGYNGLCRFNSRGVFNVPFGRYATIGYATDFADYRERFAGWSFMTGDVQVVALEPGDFVYADPPYDVEFTQYAKGGFSWADQERTAVWLAKHRGPVVLVNQATERVETLYRKLRYHVDFLEAPRRISCTGDRTPAREIIGTRNL
jgi:DNA adenine methylase